MTSPNSFSGMISSASADVHIVFGHDAAMAYVGLHCPEKAGEKCDHPLDREQDMYPEAMVSVMLKTKRAGQEEQNDIVLILGPERALALAVELGASALQAREAPPLESIPDR